MKIIDNLKHGICLAECDCGDVSTYHAYNIKSGNTTRCKKCSYKSRGEKRRTHCCSITFKDKSPEKVATYKVWSAMKRRCLSEKDTRFSRYGGRGIKVCESWANSFESFIDDMGFRPTSSHQIDRTDNNGNYEKSNCKWVTRIENSRNKSNNAVILIENESRCVAEWAQISGTKAATISARLTRGWNNKAAVFGSIYKKSYNTPDGKFNTLKEVQEFYSMSSSGARARFVGNSFTEWSIEKCQ